MKNNYRKTIAIAMGTWIFASQLAAQIFLYDIDAVNGHVNVPTVGASGQVNFFEEAGQWKSTVSILNDSTVPATITGFYILKPFEFTATALDTAPSDWDLIDGSTAGGSDEFGNLLNEYFNFDGEPGTGADAQYLYFGAAADQPNDGITTGNSGLFTFLMEDLSGVDWNDYLAAEVPHIFVRWQEVGLDGEGSAKGYGGFTPVPEPSLIGGLAVAGLGGLLWVRRRLTNKGKAAKTVVS